MQFEEAVDYLLGLGHETLTIKLGLRNTELLFQSLDNPQRSFPAVQIAGTNGKGSTASVLDSICRASGIRTGLYTSPHLVSITERVKIAGNDISREDFARYTGVVRSASYSLLERNQVDALPTYFEQVTAIALLAFREAEIDLAILETGLGGRLDSTTAARAEIVAITQIAFDHEEYLGTTLASIAAEKAAIIRPGVKAVIAQQAPEAMAAILAQCEATNVIPLLDACHARIEHVTTDGRYRVTFSTANDTYPNVLLGLRGKHQIENVAVAIPLAELLRQTGFPVTRQTIVAGIESAIHPGRLELIQDSSRILLDGAHNPAGALTLREYLDQFAARPLTLIFGAMRDKRLDEIAATLFPVADHVVLTAVENPRTASGEALLDLGQRFAPPGEFSLAVSSSDALKHAIANGSNGTICVTGSLYLVGEIRPLLVEASARREGKPDSI